MSHVGKPGILQQDQTRASIKKKHTLASHISLMSRFVYLNVTFVHEAQEMPQRPAEIHVLENSSNQHAF